MPGARAWTSGPPSDGWHPTWDTSARMPTLRDLISDSRVHVLDGAMGTMLYSRGIFVNACYDELSLSQPALVREVHEAYVQAGA
ncbi:MAG TPA: homocysteine S-methyltransferase family protein, partial [Gemmatimonadales bacterium]|nr:homocysteine S-methyltransferase family protein [Gemmatimonadales bacterium]